MSILITIDSISRRDDLTVFPRVTLKPWNGAYTVSQLLQKAANVYKARNGLKGAVRFDALDFPKRLSYAGVPVFVVVGRVMAERRHYVKDISGVVEVRISGIIPEDLKS